MKKEATKTLKTIGSGLCLFLLAGMVACNGGPEIAEDDEVMTDEVATGNTWDTNRFNTTFASTNYYEEWDENDNNMLDENEYTKGFYSTWDTNNDNQIDRNEWNTAVNDWGLENEDWTAWDTNGDGMLDENEFRTSFARSGWYGEWDTNDDNMLSEREYTDGVFDRWDINNDNMLDENEYRAYNTYYGS